MRQVLAATLLVMVIVTGCVSPADPMKKFVGQPASQLEAKLGQPNERVRDRQGGEVWNYIVRQQSEQENHVIMGAYNTTDKTTPWNLSPPVAYTTLHSFFVGRDGIVYRYQSRED